MKKVSYARFRFTKGKDVLFRNKLNESAFYSFQFCNPESEYIDTDDYPQLHTYIVFVRYDKSTKLSNIWISDFGIFDSYLADLYGVNIKKKGVLFTVKGKIHKRNIEKFLFRRSMYPIYNSIYDEHIIEDIKRYERVKNRY